MYFKHNFILFVCFLISYRSKYWKLGAFGWAIVAVASIINPNKKVMATAKITVVHWKFVQLILLCRNKKKIYIYIKNVLHSAYTLDESIKCFIINSTKKKRVSFYMTYILYIDQEITLRCILIGIIIFLIFFSIHFNLIYFLFVYLFLFIIIYLHKRILSF